MPIRRRNSPKKMILLAGAQGVIIGVVGVLLFGLLLNLASDKEVAEKEGNDPSTVVSAPKDNTEDEKIDVGAEPNLAFKSRQYGMFTTKESAMSFMSAEPSLTKAGIVQIEGKFYVWSDVFANEVAVIQQEELPSFIKTFYVSTSSCESSQVQKMFTTLNEETISKNYFDSLSNKEEYPEDLPSIVQALSTFSDAPSVLRLHLFTHYLEKNNCIKLSF